LVAYERAGQVAVLTLVRPERMNALSLGTLEQLSAYLDDARDDDQVRVVIVTGAGEKAFSAGADLKERIDMTDAETRRFIRTIRETFVKLEQLSKPTIAMINGLALGGGCELALSCDIRVMADSAVIGLTETRLAIIPGAGGTQRLARLVGRGRAKELIFTGRRVSAAEALSLGLVERVVPALELRSACLALADEIGLAGPLALTQAKFAIDKGYEVDLATGLEIEGKAYEVLLPTADRREALQAFKEKRRPDFKGR
jgi:enoyl-CoA hydratase/carnithine racemase